MSDVIDGALSVLGGVCTVVGAYVIGKAIAKKETRDACVQEVKSGYERCKSWVVKKDAQTCTQERVVELMKEVEQLKKEKAEKETK
jgi:hypothetical protein